MEVLNDFGAWTFKNEEVVNQFDSHVVQSVPMYNEFHKMLTVFSRYFAMDGTTVIDIGTSTGHLLNKMYESNRSKELTYIGVDYAKEMVDKAQQTYPHLDFLQADLTLEETYNHFDNVSYITSMLCLQFINPNFRQDILTNLYNKLTDGGAFVIVEKVKSSNIDLHDIYNNTYYEFKRESGISDKEILDKNFSLQGQMFPLTMEKNIEMLQATGFSVVEVFMKYNNFVGIICIK